MRFWLGIGLLAMSWLWSLGHYWPANSVLGTVAVGLGVVLLAGAPVGPMARREAWAASGLLVVCAWLMPWPDRLPPLVLAGGLILGALPFPGRWSGRVGQGACCAGLILLVQAIVLEGYAAQTARSHELPWPLAWLVYAVARLAGLDAALDGTTVAIFTAREVLRLGATWDLLLDPATLALVTGALVFAALGAAAQPATEAGAWGAWQGWLRAARPLVAIVAVWLPMRTGLLVALLAHREVLADPASPLNLMNQFLGPGVYGLSLLGPVLGWTWWVPGWRFGPVCATGEGLSQRWPACAPLLDADVPRQAAQPNPEQGDFRPCAKMPRALGLVLTSSAMLAWGLSFDPVGVPKGGRVMVVERKSTWEPTTRPYNTLDYGEEACYTYAAIYDYAGHYFEMSRLLEADRIDAEKLAQCDVLVFKTPTARYTPEEVQAVTEFVRRGGGLLLIGEHTNFMQSSTYLNDLARPFGFQYRYDLLFWVGKPYLQPYRRPWVAHPSVQHVPAMHFAVSCSIDPGRSSGRAAIRGRGLWSLMPDYHVDNYFPNAEYRPEMRFGSFIQLWATRYGNGRVLAFTDSTIFSSFCTFEPGKAELMLGMLQWLNHRSVLDHPWLRALSAVVWVGLAAAGLGLGLWWAGQDRLAWVVVLAAVLLGWAGGQTLLARFNRWAMPPPEPLRRMVRVALDRTVSEVPLSENGFVQPDGLGYGLAQQWIARLRYYPVFRTGLEAFSDDVLVVICPTKSVPETYRQQLVEFVRSGAKLLVVDSPDVVGSTANSLLWPFGLASNHNTDAEGPLLLQGDWPGIKLVATCEIQGGEPFMWVGQTPVAARTRFGKGSVMAIGFGSVFNDQGMGMHWMLKPDEPTRTRFELFYTLVRGLVTEQSVVPPVLPEKREEAPTQAQDAEPVPAADPQEKVRPRG